MSNPKPNDGFVHYGVTNPYISSHNTRNDNLHPNNQLAMRNICQPPHFNFHVHQQLNSLTHLANQLANGNYLKNLEISANLYNRHVLSMFNRQQSQLFLAQKQQELFNLSFYNRNQTQDPANLAQQNVHNIVQQNPVKKNLMQNSNGK